MTIDKNLALKETTIVDKVTLSEMICMSEYIVQIGCLFNILS